jgi:hypothetical protein
MRRTTCDRAHLRRQRLDFRGAWQRGEQQLAAFHGLGDGVPEIRETVDRAQVVDLQSVAGALQVRRHRPAHRAQANKGDLHTAILIRPAP